MRLYWQGRWLDAPTYADVAGSIALTVLRTAPLLAVPDASGRRFQRPLAKLARFMITDGPRATFRKARAKRAEPRYSGDYRVLLALGRSEHRTLVALACKVPPFAETLPVHPLLAREVAEDFGPERLDAVASALLREPQLLLELGRQTWLYSGQEPPSSLGGHLDRALSEGGPGGGGAVEQLTAPAVDVPKGLAAPALRARGRRSGAPVAVLGAGDYVRTEVVPALRSTAFQLWGICDREPQTAELVRGDLGFESAFTDAEATIAALPSPGLVIVATAHDSHARLAASALERGHRVMLEKPAAVTAADLSLLLRAASANPGQLEVGFNRRFNPLVRRARHELHGEAGPLSIVAAAREVAIENHHWYLWPNQGTRVAGNLCHWIDMAVFLMGSAGRCPTELAVSAPTGPGRDGLDADRSLSISFDDGSLACLVLTDRGDDLRGVQEQVEARRGQLTLRLDDLWQIRTLRAGRQRRKRTLWRDKGHQAMYRETLALAGSGAPALYPLTDLATVTAIQVAATRMAESGERHAQIGEFVAGFVREATGT